MKSLAQVLPVVALAAVSLALSSVTTAACGGTAVASDAGADTSAPPTTGTSTSTAPPGTDGGGAPDALATDGATSAGCWQALSIPDVSTMGNAGAGYAAPKVAGACEGAEFVIRSNGIPTFEYVPLTPNGLQAKNYAFKIPRAPAAAATPTDIPLLGAVAVSVTGIPIFGPTENPMDGYRDPFLDDRLRNLLDDCNGHTAPQGTYHFHARPECVMVALGGEKRGLVLGWSFDGYPILAPLVCTDAACATTKRVKSSWKSTLAEYTEATRGPAWDIHAYEAGLGDLDKCNGLPITEAGAKYDYAYFATDTFPYFMGCYHGTPTPNR